MNSALLIFSMLAAGPDGPRGEPFERAAETAFLICHVSDDGIPLFVPQDIDVLSPFVLTTADVDESWWLPLSFGLSASSTTLVHLGTGVSTPVGFYYDENGDYVEGVVRRFYPAGNRLLDVDTFGPNYRETSMIEFEVPPEAAIGDDYELRQELDGDTLVTPLLVRANTAPAVTAAALAISVEGSAGRLCAADCLHDEQSIPRLPILLVDYDGDRAVLDISVTANCTLSNRIVFAGWFWIDGADSPFRLADFERFGEVGDCDLNLDRAEIIDPRTAEIVASATDPFSPDLGTLAQVEGTLYDEGGVELEVEPCTLLAGSVWDGATRERLGLPCACVRTVATGKSLVGIVALALLIWPWRRRASISAWVRPSKRE